MGLGFNEEKLPLPTEAVGFVAEDFCPGEFFALEKRVVVYTEMPSLCTVGDDGNVYVRVRDATELLLFPGTFLQYLGPAILVTGKESLDKPGSFIACAVVSDPTVIVTMRYRDRYALSPVQTFAKEDIFKLEAKLILGKVVKTKVEESARQLLEAPDYKELIRDALLELETFVEVINADRKRINARDKLERLLQRCGITSQQVNEIIGFNATALEVGNVEIIKSWERRLKQELRRKGNHHVVVDASVDVKASVSFRSGTLIGLINIGKIFPEIRADFEANGQGGLVQVIDFVHVPMELLDRIKKAQDDNKQPGEADINALRWFKRNLKGFLEALDSVKRSKSQVSPLPQNQMSSPT